MGAIFSRLRNFTTVPAPHIIRKYGMMVLFLLGVPKVTWDLWRIKNASSFQSSIDADEKKDPPIKVLRLAATKALKDMKSDRAYDATKPTDRVDPPALIDLPDLIDLTVPPD